MYVFKNSDIALIKEKIGLIKECSRGQFISNFFWQDKFEEKYFLSIFEDQTLAFLEKDQDFFRLYFFTANIVQLESIIAEIEYRPLLIDFITNKPQDSLEQVFQRSGFKLYAKMLRFRNANIPILNSISGANEVNRNNNNILNKLEKFYAKHPAKLPVSFAKEVEAEHILMLLNENLDRLTGHFPTYSELTDLIRNQQILVIRNNDMVSGFLLFKISGKTCNMDQGYSDPSNDELVNMSMFFEFYKIINIKSIKSLYCWVNEENHTVINLHQSFGFKADGLLDYVYIKN